MLVAYLRGAYFAVLIYSNDVGDGYGGVDFVKVAKINPVWLVVTTVIVHFLIMKQQKQHILSCCFHTAFFIKVWLGNFNATIVTDL